MIYCFFILYILRKIKSDAKNYENLYEILLAVCVVWRRYIKCVAQLEAMLVPTSGRMLQL
jgi:G:T-mismatch repair DNA endonuclease (very short patch repair protein)